MYVCMSFYVVHYPTIIWWKPITITKVIKYPVIAWRKWILLYLCLSERLTNQCSKFLLIGVGRGLWWTDFRNGQSWFYSPDVLPDNKPRGEINSTQTVTPQRKHLDSLTTLKWLQRIYSGYLERENRKNRNKETAY